MDRVSRGHAGTPSGGLEASDARDLATLLVRNWKLSVEQTADLLMPVISTLAAAHDVGTVHGNLSPRSILLSQGQQDVVPQVVGFGSAKAVRESIQLTGLQAPLGARTYLSPEQAMGDHDIDARSDQFSLGVVLYECLTGQAPFEAESADAVITQVVDCNYRKPRELEPSIPRALEAIIARALRKRPSDRFASMRDFGAAMLPYASRHLQRSCVAEFGPGVTRQRGRAQASARAESQPDRMISTAPGAAPAASSSSNARRRRALWALLAALIIVALLVLAARRSDDTAADTPPEPAVAPAPARAEPDDTSKLPPPAKRVEPRKAARAEPVAAASAPRTYEIDLTVEPRTAWIMLDRQAAGGGSLQRSLPRDGRTHELRVGAPGYEPQTLRFKDAAPPESLVLERKPGRPTRVKGAKVIFRGASKDR